MGEIAANGASAWWCKQHRVWNPHGQPCYRVTDEPTVQHRTRGPVRELCDWGYVGAHTCPGFDWHCARGEHCPRTLAVCAADMSHDDHGPTCCMCGATITAGATP